MTNPAERLAPADRNDLAAALAFALRFQGRERVRSIPTWRIGEL
jgi:hypothetical protein